MGPLTHCHSPVLRATPSLVSPSTLNNQETKSKFHDLINIRDRIVLPSPNDLLPTRGVRGLWPYSISAGCSLPVNARGKNRCMAQVGVSTVLLNYTHSRARPRLPGLGN